MNNKLTCPTCGSGHVRYNLVSRLQPRLHTCGDCGEQFDPPRKPGPIPTVAGRPLTNGSGHFRRLSIAVPPRDDPRREAFEAYEKMGSWERLAVIAKGIK